MFDAIFDITVGLLDRLGGVTEADETPFRAIDMRVVDLRLVPHHVPMQGQRIEARRGRRPDGQETRAVTRGEPRTRGRGDPRDRHVEQWIRVGAQVQARVDQLPAVILEIDRLVAFEKPQPARLRGRSTIRRAGYARGRVSVRSDFPRTLLSLQLACASTPGHRLPSRPRAPSCESQDECRGYRQDQPSQE